VRPRARRAARAAQGRDRPLLRPQRLDRARRPLRPGDAAAGDGRLLRTHARDRRAPRRHGGEVLLLWQDRLEEAAEWTALARAATSGEDAFDLFALDALDGAFAAAAGDAQTALRSNAAAVARADATDFFQARVAARRFRAWALNRLGDAGGARQAMAEAIAIAEAKGDVAGAARDTAWLATLA